MDIETLKNKRGQMVIWIIVGLAIMAAVIIFFLLREDVITPEVDKRVSEDPRGFIDSCVKKNVNEIVNVMLPQGGFVMAEHSREFRKTNVSYLCYNRGNYKPCVNEHPLLLNEMREEIRIYLEPKVRRCFDDYKEETEKRGISVRYGGDMKLNVELGKDRVFVDIERGVVIQQRESIIEMKNFDVEVINPVYNLGRVAMEIASQEAEYCNFEYVGYMILYPKFKISVFPMSDYTKIYSIEDKNSEKMMNIAIRSCAIPPGL